MFEQVIGKIAEEAFSLIAKGAIQAGKAIGEHLVKHGTIYATGGAVAAGTYAYGEYKEAKGHKEGKIEGTVEQAKIDETKINDINQQHEQDRQQWNKERQDYEDLLDEAENS